MNSVPDCAGTIQPLLHLLASRLEMSSAFSWSTKLFYLAGIVCIYGSSQATGAVHFRISDWWLYFNLRGWHGVDEFTLKRYECEFSASVPGRGLVSGIRLVFSIICMHMDGYDGMGGPAQSHSRNNRWVPKRIPSKQGGGVATCNYFFLFSSVVDPARSECPSFPLEIESTYLFWKTKRGCWNCGCGVLPSPKFQLGTSQGLFQLLP